MKPACLEGIFTVVHVTGGLIRSVHSFLSFDVALRFAVQIEINDKHTDDLAIYGYTNQLWAQWKQDTGVWEFFLEEGGS